MLVSKALDVATSLSSIHRWGLVMWMLWIAVICILIVFNNLVSKNPVCTFILVFALVAYIPSIALRLEGLCYPKILYGLNILFLLFNLGLTFLKE